MRALSVRSAERRLLVATCLNAVASGVFLSLALIYLTSAGPFTVQEAGTALAAAGAVGLISLLPAGRLIGLFGAARCCSAATLLQGAAVLVLTSSLDSKTSAVATLGLMGVAEKTKLAARGALIAEFGEGLRIVARARLKAYGNVSTAVGAGIAAVALVDADEASYSAVMLLVAAACAVAAVVLATLGRSHARGREPEARAGSAYRDGPYLRFCGANAALSVHYRLLDVGIPAWLVLSPGKPLWLAAAALLGNTGVIAAVQVRMSRSISTADAAAAASRSAAVLLCAACGSLWLFAVTDDPRVWAPAFAAGVLAYSVGEVLQSASSWELSYNLPSSSGRVGDYQAMHVASTGLGLTAGAAALPALLALGSAGWIGLGLFLLASGLWVASTARARRQGTPPPPAEAATSGAGAVRHGQR